MWTRDICCICSVNIEMKAIFFHTMRIKVRRYSFVVNSCELLAMTTAWSVLKLCFERFETLVLNFFVIYLQVFK